jgi:arylsulfatase A-like enzyme
LQWPEHRRPHVVTLYFEHVDTAGHDFGQGSPELAAAVAEVDANIGRLLDAIARLGLADEVHVLVVSDHGQASYVNPEASFVLRDHIDPVGLEIIAGGAYAWIYLERPDRERAVVPDLGHAVVEDRESLGRLKKGDHGWDPSNKAMHGIFLATGPALPKGETIGEVSAVEIYPLMLDLLQIDTALPAPGRAGLRSLVNRDD